MWSVGRASNARFRGLRGVTLIEMLIVVTLLSLMVGITYPSISSGIDSLRLISAADSTATFFNSALNWAERRQQAVEIVISGPDNAIVIASAEPGLERRLDMPSGVSIVTVLPEIPVTQNSPRRFLVFPGGTIPRVGVVLGNTRGDLRVVRVDPLTGTPQIRPVAEQ